MILIDGYLHEYIEMGGVKGVDVVLVTILELGMLNFCKLLLNFSRSLKQA